MTEMVANAGRIANSIEHPADQRRRHRLRQRAQRHSAPCGSSSAPASPPSISRTRSSPRSAAISRTRSWSSREDYVAKIRAAAARQASPDFLSSRAPIRAPCAGFDEAIAPRQPGAGQRRRRGFRRGAADAWRRSSQVPKLVKGPCLLNMVCGGKTPDVPLADAERMGYAITILPGLLLRQHHRDLRPDARRGEETRQVPAAAGRVARRPRRSPVSAPPTGMPVAPRSATNSKPPPSRRGTKR